MNINIRRRYDTFVRIKQFGLDNVADFPALSVGAVQFAAISAVIDQIETLGGDQTQGFGEARFAYNNKAIARINLRDQLDDISEMSRSMVYEFAGIDLKFRVTRNINDSGLISLGNAFIVEAADYKEDFIRYGLNSNFIDVLEGATLAFEQSFGATSTAMSEQVAATASLTTAAKEGMIARKILNGVVKIKYKNNVGKLAAWESAAHIERQPKKKEPTPPITPIIEPET